MTEQTKEQLKRVIEQTLRVNNLTVEALAKQIGVSQGLLSQVKFGTRNLTVDATLKLAEIARISGEERAHLLLGSILQNKNAKKAWDEIHKTHCIELVNQQYMGASGSVKIQSLLDMVKVMAGFLQDSLVISDPPNNKKDGGGGNNG